MTQQIERQLIEPSVLMQVCQTMMQNGEAGQALELMRMGFERMADTQRPDIGHNLSVMLLNQDRPRQAGIYLREVLRMQAARYSSWLHLAFSEIMCGNQDGARKSLEFAQHFKPSNPAASDTFLNETLSSRLSMSKTSNI